MNNDTESPESPESSESPNIAETNDLEGGGDLPSQLFARAYGFVTWFMGLRWYIIVLVVVFGSFIFFQLEYAIETRKQKRESKKEGLHMKSILRKADRENRIDTSLKRVSFIPFRIKDAQLVAHSSLITAPEGGVLNEKRCNPETYTSSVLSPLIKIYEWWIVPLVYVLFRSMGFRLR